MTDEPTKNSSPFLTAYYDCNLPVFKQGDDLAHHLAEEETVADAFEALAVQYEEAAAHCRRMVGLVREVPEIDVDACTHHIGIKGPAVRLDPLVEEGLLSRSCDDEEEVEGIRDGFTELVLDEFNGKGSFLPQDAADRLSELDEDFTGMDPVWVLATLEEMVVEGSLVREAEGHYRVSDPEED
jgi:hypothetical protein